VLVVCLHYCYNVPQFAEPIELLAEDCITDTRFQAGDTIFIANVEASRLNFQVHAGDTFTLLNQPERVAKNFKL
jgi:hypothetical protein